MENHYVQVLIDTIHKKEEVLHQILEITRQQEQLSKRDTYASEEMEAAMNEKEILIARLNYLDDGFESVYDRIRSELRNHMENYRQEIGILQDAIRRCTEKGNEIQILEERNRNRFSMLFSNARSQYATSRTQANVAQNYHKMMNHSKIADAYFVDHKQ
ncbi:MAG: hypothetical protein J6A03_00680 [Lachnospiraceae bacterium]|nr:hypothetical protein [Lachnospiraceae bacterium]